MADTVRLSILKYIQGLYQAATADDPAPEGKHHYGIAFSTVQLAALSDSEATKRFAVGIVTGEERKSDLFPLKTAILEVNIEFRETINKNDEAPPLEAEKLLGIVQQIMYDDETRGGLIIKHEEAGNEIDLVTYSDRTVRGVVKFMVHYRHAHNNVYDPNPTV